MIKTDDEISLKSWLKKASEWYAYLYPSGKIISYWPEYRGSFRVGLFFLKVVYTASYIFRVGSKKIWRWRRCFLGLASSFGIDLGGGGGDVFTETQWNCLKSRSMVGKPCWVGYCEGKKRVSLARDVHQNQEWRAKWMKSKYKTFNFIIWKPKKTIQVHLTVS
jgi:hypothetical protein